MTLNGSRRKQSAHAAAGVWVGAWEWEQSVSEGLQEGKEREHRQKQSRRAHTAQDLPVVVLFVSGTI